MAKIIQVNLEERSTKVGTVRYSPVQSSWTGQYKNCVQYDFKFTSIYSGAGYDLRVNLCLQEMFGSPHDKHRK